MQWVVKHKPKKLSGIKGQDNSLNLLKLFIQNYARQKKKAVLLYGPTGTGKTLAIHLIAKEMNLEIVEINASDLRNSEEIEKVLGTAMKQKSLFYTGKLILVDEIDGIAGREDRGGLNTLGKLIDDSFFPVVMTSNSGFESNTDDFDRKFSSLKKKAMLIEFKQVDILTLTNILKEICKTESIKCDDNAVSMLARRSSGDVRAAINDLQLLSVENKKIELQDLTLLSDRKHTETIKQGLLKIFKTTSPEIALSAFEDENDLDQIFLWMDENIQKEYTNPEDLANAYDSLSLADIYRRRIMRWQYWRFLVYVRELLTAGVALSKKEKYQKLVEYKETSRLLKIWIYGNKNLRRKQITEKISGKLHVSKKKAFKEVVPYIKLTYKKNKDFAKNFEKEFEISPEEIEWLKK
jgi:replication factor C large subunit